MDYFLSAFIDLVCKVAYLFAFFGGLVGVLGFARWYADAPKRARRNRPMTRPHFGGGGQSLGRASAADSQKARMARIASNRFQMQATMAKQEAKRPLFTKQKQRNRVTVPRTTTSCPFSVRHPSPRSVMQVPSAATVLPNELRPESTAHFFVHGATKFIALPPLLKNTSQEDVAVQMLRRIAHEFMPIIHKRGFNIRSVSEMCCCGDGLEYELGGERRSVPAGETIVGNDADNVAGYNGKLINHFGRAEHVIHLRLRTVDDHDTFMDYETEIVDTMAHELAHCVHEDHGPEFWDLMEDILADRDKIVQDFKKNEGDVLASRGQDPSSASREQFGGFDIYQSVSGQLRNWNGQVIKA